MIAVQALFWVAVGLLVYTHVGYPILLVPLVRLRGRAMRPDEKPEPTAGTANAEPPHVSLIVAAHDEERVIAAKVADALALDYPRARLELIVASDGSTDRTAQLARAAGADLVLELERRGKVAAQNAAAERAGGTVLAFSDANARWSPDALRELVAVLADARVGYVCGRASFVDQGGSNQEGAYWRYELAVRDLESRLAGVTGGNGAIYAVRREAFIPLGPASSHDLSFPFMLSKRGWWAAYAPRAMAEEKAVPTLEGEFARKRRMMRGLFDEVVGDGMLSPRGYPPVYAFQIASHRLIRYLSPALHLIALGANLALLGEGTIYVVTLALQLALLLAAALAPALPWRPLRLARYYVLVTASIAAGLWDRVRLGVPGAWEKPEGTR